MHLYNMQTQKTDFVGLAEKRKKEGKAGQTIKIMNTSSTQNNISIFLLGAILNILAAVDYVSLVDYSLKAILGGIIWLGFKILAEHLTMKMRDKNQAQDGK